ncbi:protein rep [Candidatus Pacearchaeota archaeon]|nr:protein rep [Candidatus Pacearchaeota archaeon]
MVNSKVTSVQALETTSPLSMPRTYREHSTGHCIEEVEATRQVYASFDDRAAERRLNSFDTCRARSWFVRHTETGNVRVATKSCKLRWCPLCAKKRQWFLVQQIKPWAESIHRLKFLTLTLKHSDAPLKVQIDNLYKAFQRFRKLKYLREHMFGGIWFFQIKKSERSGQWHPHLHCLIEADYMPHAKLSALWCRTTNGSIVVDIRPAGDPDKVAEYVGRYSARPSDLAGLPESERIEVVQALHGRRLMGTWGSARQMTTKMEKPEDADQWKYVGSWSTVWGTLAYDENAKKIFKAWKMDEPLESNINMGHIEDYFWGREPFKGKEPPEHEQLYFDFSEPLF